MRIKPYRVVLSELQWIYLHSQNDSLVINSTDTATYTLVPSEMSLTKSCVC